MLDNRPADDDAGIREEDIDETRVWERMAGMQKSWNNLLVTIGRPACRSLLNLHVFKKAERPAHMCNHQLCPSCWYMTRMNVISHLLTFDESDTALWYLRYSEPIEYTAQPSNALQAAFRSNGSSYNMLGYEIQLGADKLVPEAPGWVGGELFHRYMGVFVAPKLVQLEWRKTYNNRFVAFRDMPTGERLNIVHSSKQDVIGMYAGMQRPPGYVYRHPALLDYVHRFAPTRWAGSTNRYNQMFKTCIPTWMSRCAPQQPIESIISVAV